MIQKRTFTSDILKVQDLIVEHCIQPDFGEQKNPQNRDVAQHLKRILQPSPVYSQCSAPEKVETFFINTKLFINGVGIKHFNLSF